MIKAYGGPFWFAGFLQLIISALTFASPFLLRELIGYTESQLNPMIETQPFWQGMLLTFAFFMVSLLLAIINAQYFKNTFLVGFRIRTGVISAIYRKALRISSAAKKDSTVGEIVNLMAIDAQSFFELISYVHIIWSGPIVIGITIWLLWDILGIAVVSGIVVMFLMFPITGVLATKLQQYQISEMAIKDERVKLMNEILNGIKVLKLYAWEQSFQELILDARAKEMVILRKAAVLNAGTYFVWILVPFLVTLVTYITYVLLGEVLDPQVAFVSITLFNILSGPMAMGKRQKYLIRLFLWRFLKLQCR